MPVVLRWLLRLGPTNPIAVRLVQGGSRRARHFYIRTIYLGVLIVALLFLLLQKAGPGTLDYRVLASGGATSFQFVAYLQIGLICLLAPVFMAGAIAQEANPRTWDILLTTPLGATEIVLGNLFGRLFFVLALLLSSMPLFALTQFFGGVPGRTIFASYAVAVCATLLVGSLAISLSVSRLVGRRAVFAFYVCVISYLALTWGIDGLIGGGRVSWMTGLNPFLALRALLEPTNYPRAVAGLNTGVAALLLEKPVTAWCALSAGVSFVLVVVSIITVRAGGIAGLGGLTGRSESGSVPWYRRMLGLSARGYSHRPPRRVWHNPIAWREAAARNATFGRILARWTFIGLGGLWALFIVVNFHYGGTISGTVPVFRQVILYTVMGELIVLSLIAVNMAATSVAKEREDGTLDILLTTPITQGSYISGKLRGMIAYLLPMLAVPLGTLTAAGFYVGLARAGVLGTAGAVEVSQTMSSGTAITVPAIIPEAGVVATIVTVPFTAFCVMVGMHWSLKSKGSITSVIATVGFVGVIAGVVGLCAYQAGRDIPYLGAGMAAMSPATAAFATIDPVIALEKTVTSADDITQARVGLFIGAVVCGCIYLAVVYGLHGHMVRTFDMTVRKLAGEAR